MSFRKTIRRIGLWAFDLTSRNPQRACDMAALCGFLRRLKRVCTKAGRSVGIAPADLLFSLFEFNRSDIVMRRPGPDPFIA